MPMIAFKNVLNNLSNKLVAIGFGVAVWYIATEHRVYEKKIAVPVCFYNLRDEVKLNAPESVTITVAGTRRKLLALKPEDCSLHLDAEMFEKPLTCKAINSVDFFVPESVRVVHCNQSYVEIKHSES